MGWADHPIRELAGGRRVTIHPRGHSMTPVVRDREAVTLEPLTWPPDVHDVVLVQVRGRVLLHQVGAVRGDQAQIKNARGHVNGWVHRHAVYGRRMVTPDGGAP